ncbi:MAG: hypothetical protein KJ558_04315 [Gammaproteobacteria bacterium]|nr:hypothetical protein [Gammaproteobacteria bacterium]MBU1654045.1 hypothetical protein [Gammaproteobacteria bacterium]MBU1961745.1 hypothetical protein [Gammaproteobacteria bacterium]
MRPSSGKRVTSPFHVLAENSHMLDLCAELGFAIHPSREDAALRLVRRRL